MSDDDASLCLPRSRLKCLLESPPLNATIIETMLEATSPICMPSYRSRERLHSMQGDHLLSAVNLADDDSSSAGDQTSLESSSPQDSSSIFNTSFSSEGSNSRSPSKASKISSPASKNPQQCSVCQKIFSSSSALAKHKLTHSDDRKYVCSICNKRFKRQDHLTGHMMTHQSQKPFMCTEAGCDRSYCDQRSLRRHMENQHSKVIDPSEIRKIKVPKLSSDGTIPFKHASPDGSPMNGSIVIDDAPQEPSVCNICHRSFPSLPALNGHMRLHGGYDKAGKELAFRDKMLRSTPGEDIQKAMLKQPSPKASKDHPRSPKHNRPRNLEIKSVKAEPDVFLGCLNSAPPATSSVTPKPILDKDLNKEVNSKLHNDQRFTFSQQNDLVKNEYLPQPNFLMNTFQYVQPTVAPPIESPQNHSQNEFVQNLPSSPTLPPLPPLQPATNYMNNMHTFQNSIPSAPQPPSQMATFTDPPNAVKNNGGKPQHYTLSKSPCPPAVNKSVTFALPPTSMPDLFPLRAIPPRETVGSNLRHNKRSYSVEDYMLYQKPELDDFLNIVDETINDDLKQMERDRERRNSLSSEQHRFRSTTLGSESELVQRPPLLPPTTDLDDAIMTYDDADDDAFLPSDFPQNPSNQQTFEYNTIPTTQSYPQQPQQVEESFFVFPPASNSNWESQKSTTPNVVTNSSTPATTGTYDPPYSYADESLFGDNVYESIPSYTQSSYAIRRNSVAVVTTSDWSTSVAASSQRFSSYNTLSSTHAPENKLLTNLLRNTIQPLRRHSASELCAGKAENSDPTFKVPSVPQFKPSPLTLPPSSSQSNMPADGELTTVKRKAKPTHLSIPKQINNTVFQSCLRSPRRDNGEAPPYTPPPMLSPMRKGQGLFTHQLPPQATPLHARQLRRSLSGSFSADNDVNFLDPKINIGSSFQAELPTFRHDRISLLQEPVRADLVWSPDVISNISESEVDSYFVVANSCCVNGGGQNLEFAHHCLYRKDGSIVKALRMLLSRRVRLPEQHPLSDYSYTNSTRWTPEERSLFSSLYHKYQKDFGKISKYISSKTIGQIVEYYYLWKKFCVEDYTTARQQNPDDQDDDSASLIALKRRKMSCAYDNCSETFDDDTQREAHLQLHLELSTPRSSYKDAPETPLYSQTHHVINDDLFEEERTQSNSCYFPCRLCGKVFTKVKSRNAHMKSHSQKVIQERARNQQQQQQQQQQHLSTGIRPPSQATVQQQQQHHLLQQQAYIPYH